MSGVNFVNSVAPSYNALSALLQGQMIGAPGGQQQGRGPLGGPLAANMATAYRPPTRVAEENMFGQRTGWRESNQEDRNQYNQQWLGDRRNQGYGAGQVDPGLARAAMAQGGGGEEKSGGK